MLLKMLTAVPFNWYHVNQRKKPCSISNFTAMTSFIDSVATVLHASSERPFKSVFKSLPYEIYRGIRLDCPNRLYWGSVQYHNMIVL